MKTHLTRRRNPEVTGNLFFLYDLANDNVQFTLKLHVLNVGSFYKLVNLLA